MRKAALGAFGPSCLTPAMFSTRMTLAVTVLSAATLLAGCSGSDDGGEPDAAPSSTSPAAPETPKMFERTCEVTVEMSGAATASWQGEGRSSNEAGATIYTFVDGDDRISVYSGTEDLPTSANVTVEGATYTTTDPDTGLDVQVDGSSAQVDADTTGVDDAGPHLTASFTCAEGDKKKDKKE